MAPLLGNRRCHGNHLCRTRWGSPTWELPSMKLMWRVMVHVTCTNYMPVSPIYLTYFHHNWVMWPGSHL